MENLEFNRVSDTLENKLESRLPASHLLEKGIIKNSLTVSPSIHEKQSRLKFQQTGHQLDKKLTKRPDINHLIDQNIISDSPEVIAPSLQSSKKSFHFHQLQSLLNQKLDNNNRPSHDQLVDSSIIKLLDVDNNSTQNNNINNYHINICIYCLNQQQQQQETREEEYGEKENQCTCKLEYNISSTSPSSLSTMYMEESSTRKQTLENKLVNRMDRSTLIQNNIIKSVEISPLIQSKQSSLELKLKHLSTSIDSKLHQRPIQQHLIDNNILKEENSQHNHINKTQTITNSLDHKLINRPTPETLLNYNILKEKELSSPSIQYNRNKLKFQQTKQLLNQKVESRPTKDELVDSHILLTNEQEDKENSLQINNNNNHSITRADTLNEKLHNRPKKQDLINNHILTSSDDPHYDVYSQYIEQQQRDEEIEEEEKEDDDQDIDEYLIGHPINNQLSNA